MKRIFLSLLFGVALHADQTFSYNLAPVKVSDRIYCFFGAPVAMDRHNNGNMVNSCFVQMPQGWLVIDSGPTYQYAEQAFDAMRKIADIPVRIVINTHVHDDHWLGNGFYMARGAAIVGPEHFATAVDVKVKTRMQQRISPQAYEKTVPMLPSELLGANRTFTFGSEKVTVRLTDLKAHTEQELYVVIPSLGVLFGGDLIFNDRLPSLRDGDINGWIAELEQMKAMKLPIVIGGHGRRTDAKALDFTYDYLVTLRDAVRIAIEEAVDIDDAVETITMKAYTDAGMYDMLHRQNVEVAYRMLEWDE